LSLGLVWGNQRRYKAVCGEEEQEVVGRAYGRWTKVHLLNGLFNNYNLNFPLYIKPPSTAMSMPYLLLFYVGRRGEPRSLTVKWVWNSC
jgi:hypothetical protein